MSMNDVSIRFAEVMKTHDNYQSVSLPLIVDSNEVIFFYYAAALPNGFVLEELGDIASRDLKTSTITIKRPSELFQPNELKALTQHEEVTTLTGIDAYESVTACYDLHEQLLRQGIERAGDEFLGAYLETFSRIVPKSNLRKVYFRIGEPLFQHISRRTGKRLDL